MTDAPPHVASSAELARGLLSRIDELTDDLVERIRTGDHAYAETTALTEEQLRVSVFENVDAILHQLATGSRGRLDAASNAGRLKAAQGVPLAALLHAYRLAGRAIWDQLVLDAGPEPPEWLPRVASDLWTFIDEFSSAAAEAYGLASAERAGRDAQSRALLLNSLLSGEGSSAARHVDVLRLLRLPDTGAFVVAVAEVSAPGVEPLARVEERLRRHAVHSVWLVELDAQVGLLSLGSAKSYEIARQVLVDLAAARVGVSRQFATPDGARAALREAKLAIRCSAPGSVEVNSYGESPVPLLVAHSPEAGRLIARSVFGAVLELQDDEAASLLETLSTWFECGGSATDAARRLHFHRNTIHYRLRRIEQLTGRNCADPKAAAELYCALAAMQLVGERSGESGSAVRNLDRKLSAGA
ncbi:CdaR family transcriptional regulator [Antrihabitans sp. YC2-6]|uniref:PucR family transcriptional regulator n=1 Tax=Antrihabitans sp. YC2-6 TaxID=2799498 RepID=UPI0018F58378|nr:helix-turn-helix domain-containing protein [Antrihabitans sp. YC2-6]MBJ8344637.1 helix-turn-helix domain-containing protein [Antrihabitans sp. YC2-6]